MTIQDMDICLNISNGPTAGDKKQVNVNKAHFFKPQVKRLAKKLKNGKNEKNKTDASVKPKGSKNVRIKQKSLAAIVAKNVARAKTVTFHESIKNNDEKKSVDGKKQPGKKTSNDEKNKPSISFSAPTKEHPLKSILAKPRNNETKQKKSLSDIFSEKKTFSDEKTKPLVSFSTPTKENALKTILAKPRSNETKSKKSLSDIFSKNSGKNEVETKLLSSEPKQNQDDQNADKKFPHARNFFSDEAQQFRRDDKRKRKRNFDGGTFGQEEKSDKPVWNKPSGKIVSLFGNNPEIPNMGQRLVKPVDEKVFSTCTFSELGVHAYTVSNLEQNMGITKTTTVQQKAIPVILSGKNVLVRSQTGSGKTLSYALPIVETLHSIRPKLSRNSGLKALVVVPTRELALQTYECFLKLVKPFTWIVPGYLVGGEKRKAEKARLRRGCSILIATPGRLLDHIQHTEALKLGEVKCFVLDEADRMLDMGYEKDISGIVEALKKQSEVPSYDPLELVRNRNKINKEDTKKDEENICEDNEVKDSDNEESKMEEEDSEDVNEETQIQSEYHSGTDSDEDDQEFLIRNKKSKKDQKLTKEKSTSSLDVNIKKLSLSSENSENSSRQTVLLSATLTAAVEKLAGLTLTNPVFVDAAQENLNETNGSLSEMNEDLVVPQRVTQTYIVTPPKLRMVTLSAYIAGKCQTAGEHKMLVFMATQDMIDYHADILSTVLCKPRDDDDEDSDPLVDVEFFKLHGNMSQKERTEVFKTFRKARSGVLFCTDVAARGLDVPKVDTVIQYTGPLSPRDYVHRIGRTGRAGTSGTSTIFLTPPEVDFVRLLESRRIRIKQENMNDILDKLVGPLSKQGSVEATATALQNEFENLVIKNKKFHAKACKAYVSWVRFYASYPRDMREIFNRKDLHLGHYAKSFALRDPPQRIGGIGKTLRDKEPSKQQHNNRLSNERPKPEKRQNPSNNGPKYGNLKKSRMLNTSEYDSGLEVIKKDKK